MLLLFILAVCRPFLRQIKLVHTYRVSEISAIPRPFRWLLPRMGFKLPGEMFSCGLVSNKLILRLKFLIYSYNYLTTNVAVCFLCFVNVYSNYIAPL